MVLLQRLGRSSLDRVVRKGSCEEVTFHKRADGQEGHLTEAYSTIG